MLPCIPCITATHRCSWRSPALQAVNMLRWLKMLFTPLALLLVSPRFKSPELGTQEPRAPALGSPKISKAPSPVPLPSVSSSLRSTRAVSSRPDQRSHRFLVQVLAALALHQQPCCIREICPGSAAPSSPLQLIQVSCKMAPIQRDQMLS